MTKLGKPDGNNYEVGTYAFASGATRIEEGLFFQINGNGEAVNMAAAGKPAAVAGQDVGATLGGVSGVTRTNEYGVWVQADTGVSSVTAGAQVYVTPAGQATGTATDNIATSAVFAREEVRADGIVNQTATPRNNQKCVCVKFIGGLQ
jgi:hypothetical protein